MQRRVVKSLERQPCRGLVGVGAKLQPQVILSFVVVVFSFLRRLITKKTIAMPGASGSCL
jgi:hypothetical protein